MWSCALNFLKVQASIPRPEVEKKVEALVNSFVLIVISEMGDKTQLLSLVLAARFKKPVPIIMGILFATLLNHALAGYAGSYVTQYVSDDLLKWILGMTFVVFGLWMLIPDQDQELTGHYKWGPFLTTLVVFFFAEMGDKTQLATVALGAKYQAPLLVTIGTTLGMLVADGLAVIFGYKFLEKISMKWMYRIASITFILFGIGIILGF